MRYHEGICEVLELGILDFAATLLVFVLLLFLQRFRNYVAGINCIMRTTFYRSIEIVIKNGVAVIFL